MINIANKYLSNNLSIIGCRNKRPVQSWNDFKERLATPEDIERMFDKLAAKQIAIVCGAISGNLEVIDIDVKADDYLQSDIMVEISDYFDGKPDEFLVCVSTVSGGLHLYYKCDVIEGNQKLSKRETGEVMIETRGEGGYVIAPPSEGYEVTMGSIDDIKTITPSQRDDLLSVCRSFNQYVSTFIPSDKPKKITSHEYSSTPWDEYNNDQSDPWIQVLEKHGWEEVPSIETSVKKFFKRPGTIAKFSANWHKDKRLLYVWTTSTIFEPERAYTPAAIYTYLECNGDFNRSAIRFKDMGYGYAFTKSEEIVIDKAKSHLRDGLPADLIQEMISYDFDKAGIKSDDDKKKLLKTAEYQSQCENGLFWDTTSKNKASINLIRFAEYLSEKGFYRLYEKKYSKAFDIIHLDHEKRIAYYTNPALIKDELDKMLLEYNWSDFNITIDQARTIVAEIGKDKWERIFEKFDKKYNDNIFFLRDTELESFFPFKNGVVKVTAEDIAFLDYSQLPDDCYIWYDQIIQREIHTKGIEYEVQRCDSDFYRFVKRIAGIDKISKSSIPKEKVQMIQSIYSFIAEKNNQPDFYNQLDDDDFYLYLDLDILKEDDDPLYFRIAAFFSSVGYLLCNYKDPSKAYCITIAEDTANDGLGGGTGKSLLMEGIRKMRNVEKEDGKNWKSDSIFAFQKIKYGLDVLYFEDVRSDFNFEIIYNLITNDASIEKKNRDAFNMNFKDTPKIAISTNYDITAEGDHSDRRNKKILVSRYFHSRHEPIDEFPKRFFDQWDDTDWSDFYNSMFYFVQFYLKNGILSFEETTAIKIKAVKIKYKESFFDYITYFFKEYSGKEVFFADMYEGFLDEYDEKKYWTTTRFGQAVKFFCKKFDITYEKGRAVAPSLLGGHETKKHRTYTFDNYKQAVDNIKPFL